MVLLVSQWSSSCWFIRFLQAFIFRETTTDLTCIFFTNCTIMNLSISHVNWGLCSLRFYCWVFNSLLGRLTSDSNIFHMWPIFLTVDLTTDWLEMALNPFPDWLATISSLNSLLLHVKTRLNPPKRLLLLLFSWRSLIQAEEKHLAAINPLTVIPKE